MSDYKTYSQKPAEVDRQWILIDAKDATLGRIANTVSKYLVGKYKPTYTPHVDGGDYVVVINASELIVTGDKETDKKYHNFTHFTHKMVKKSQNRLTCLNKWVYNQYSKKRWVVRYNEKKKWIYINRIISCNYHFSSCCINRYTNRIKRC